MEMERDSARDLGKDLEKVRDLGMEMRMDLR